MSVQFIIEDVHISIQGRTLIRSWIEGIINRHGRKLDALCFVYGSDAFLLARNQTYLKHHSLTDVITFDYSEGARVSGDVLLSVDRVIENAQIWGSSPNDEMLRVMVHGVLHLLGYKDKQKTEKAEMRRLEDDCLALVPQGIGFKMAKGPNPPGKPAPNTQTKTG